MGRARRAEERRGDGLGGVPDLSGPRGQDRVQAGGQRDELDESQRHENRQGPQGRARQAESAMPRLRHRHHDCGGQRDQRDGADGPGRRRAKSPRREDGQCDQYPESDT